MLKENIFRIFWTKTNMISKQTWQIFKSIVNKNKRAQVNPKLKLNNGSFITNKAIISSKFNDFLSILSQIWQTNSISKYIPTSVYGRPIANSIFLSDVTIEKKNNTISSLKNGTAGWNEFTPQMIKEIRCAINSPLVHICNLSLQQGLFPDESKISNVLPLFKACDPCVFNNYRPVSLLCVLSMSMKR